MKKHKARQTVPQQPKEITDAIRSFYVHNAQQKMEYATSLVPHKTFLSSKQQMDLNEYRFLREIVFLGQDQRFAATSHAGPRRIVTWDLTSMNPVLNLPTNSYDLGNITSVGRINHNNVVLYDWRSGQSLREFKVNRTTCFFMFDRQYLLVNGSDETSCFDIPSGKKLITVTHAQKGSTILPFANSTFLVERTDSSSHFNVGVYDLTTRKQIGVDTVIERDYSVQGLYLLNDGTVVVHTVFSLTRWDVELGVQLNQIDFKTIDETCYSFASVNIGINGLIAATILGNVKKVVIVWNAKTNEIVQEYETSEKKIKVQIDEDFPEEEEEEPSILESVERMVFSEATGKIILLARCFRNDPNSIDGFYVFQIAEVPVEPTYNFKRKMLDDTRFCDLEMITIK